MKSLEIIADSLVSLCFIKHAKKIGKQRFCPLALTVCATVSGTNKNGNILTGKKALPFLFVLRFLQAFLNV